MISGATFSTAILRPTAMARIHPVIRLGALALGLASSLLAAPVFLVAIAIALVFMLSRTGLGPGAQLATLKPWWGASILVLLIHTFTSTWAAPLWHPSVPGLLAGVVALVRVACSIGWLGLYLRVSSLDDVVLGTRWWLLPLARLGLPIENLGLVLAVALGTAPGVLGQGRRIETVVRLRRTCHTRFGDTGSSGFSFRKQLDSLVDRSRVIIPLLETLVRRAEALSLSLRMRQPVQETGSTGGVDGPPGAQFMVLVLWLLVLVWWVIADSGVWSNGGMS